MPTPGPVQAYSQQDFLDMLDRLLPDHWIAPLKDPGPGYELLQAGGQVGNRLSVATQRLGENIYILSAPSGAYATGAVEIFRAAPNADAITVVVKIGTQVRSSKGGRTYLTTADVTFGPADLGPFLVPIQATAQGYEYNEPGTVITADGTSLPGEIDTIDILVEDPPVGDLTFQIRQPMPTTGGVDAALDQHGADRLIVRGVGEGDDAYRARIRTLPDNISPDAIERALQQLLYPIGQTYDFIETFEPSYQTCWDGPETAIPGSIYDPTLFCYDDPRPIIPFRNRWLDVNDMRGAFIVVVPPIAPITEYGMAYDDTTVTPSDLANPLGSRAVGAYDVPSTIGHGLLQGAYDGYDTTRAALMKTLYDTIQSIKAAGISAAVELEGA